MCVFRAPLQYNDTFVGLLGPRLGLFVYTGIMTFKVIEYKHLKTERYNLQPLAETVQPQKSTGRMRFGTGAGGR
jgi:hypothetical protein